MKIKTFKFIKEKNNWVNGLFMGTYTWYIDYPEYIEQGLGGKCNLAMVQGADLMLDYLGKGETEITVKIHTKPFAGNQVELIMYKHNWSGGTYKTNVPEIDSVWLCNVTKHVFDGKHPHKLYFALA